MTVPEVSLFAASMWWDGISAVLIAVPLLASFVKRLGPKRLRVMVWLAAVAGVASLAARIWALTLPHFASQLLAAI